MSGNIDREHLKTKSDFNSLGEGRNRKNRWKGFVNDGSQFQAWVTWAKEETGSLSDLVSRGRREHERRKTYGKHFSARVCLWSASDEQSGRKWWEKMGQRDIYTILDVSVKLWRVEAGVNCSHNCIWLHCFGCV